MIFNQKEHPKLFWVEGLVYLAIIAMCMLGSFGVFDAWAQLTELPDPQTQTLFLDTNGVPNPLDTDVCKEWIETSPELRIMILTQFFSRELEGRGLESLIKCLSEQNNVKYLDKAVVDECKSSQENVFENRLRRIVFKCLKWVKE